MLSIQNYSKKYDDNTVLNHVDLQIQSGDVIAIIGPSGSGKSTLLKTLNFLVHPDSGSIQYKDQTYDTQKIRPKEIYALRRSMGMVFQNFGLFSHKTALENLTLVLTKVQKMPQKKALSIAQKTLDQVGLSDKYDAYPHQLSGGQQQRVGIARALAASPDILLFDEPTSALDPELVGEVQKVIKNLALQGQTMLVVTHEMDFARQVANRVIFMEEGHIRIDGSPNLVFGTQANDRIKRFIGKLGYSI